jgi:hypothetical protein|tara:strand:- start:594 stop:911 length:318 start_codon:yes stop_codon:yes gene_type:complete
MEPEKSILKEFLNGGWLVPLVGAAAMFARLLSGNSGLSLKQQFKRVATAAIAAGIAWFVLEQTDVSSLTKAITYGIIGVISPEVISGIVRLAEKFAKNPEKFLKK